MNDLSVVPRAVTLRPATVSGVLAALALGFVVLHLMLQAYLASGGGGVLSYTIAPKFSLDGERTIPAYFSGLLLLAVSVLLASIAGDQTARRERWYWGVLALIFLLLSIDEICSFHEILVRPVQSGLNTRSWFRFAWVIPGLIFVALFTLSYLGFFLRLPRRFQFLFALSGILYVGGAIGMEMVGGWQVEAHGSKTLAYLLIYTVEETMEMIGMVVFIYTLLLYKSLFGRDLQIHFASGGEQAGV